MPNDFQALLYCQSCPRGGLLLTLVKIPTSALTRALEALPAQETIFPMSAGGQSTQETRSESFNSFVNSLK